LNDLSAQDCEFIQDKGEAHSMIKFDLNVCLMSAALLVGNAAASELAPIKRVPTADPPVQASGPERRTLDYRKTVIDATNDRFGRIDRGVFCSGDLPLILNAKMAEVIGNGIARMARKEFKRLGYAVNREDSAFSANSPATSADYEVAGTLKGIASRMCTDGARENAGEVWVQVKWELFSPKQQRVVHSLVTEGSVYQEKKVDKTMEDLFDQAYSAAMLNALADPGLLQRIRQDPGEGSSAVTERTLDRLVVARGPEARDAADSELSLQRSAVVTVFSGTGTGSGFYINADGYLLTNQHVVGDAKYVKIRLATGREIVGEVLRLDRQRDVALIKTEPVALLALPVARNTPATGDDVFLIGSPYGERFASSVTKGVTSGTTTVDSRRYLQSDVKLLPGNSGGPLIRRDGAVVGIAVGGVGRELGATVNLFIPIDDAFAKLGIGIVP
jgi:S1-C subfamily serine protease